MGMVGVGEHMQAIHGVMVTRLTRNNPAINAYAMKVFGSTDLSDAQWKQCEEQMKVSILLLLWSSSSVSSSLSASEVSMLQDEYAKECVLSTKLPLKASFVYR